MDTGKLNAIEGLRAKTKGPTHPVFYKLIKTSKMKFKLLLVLFLVFISCHGQTTVKVSENCDTIVIENPLWDAQKEGYENQITGLEGIVQEKDQEITTLNQGIASRDAMISQNEETIINQDTEIKDLKVVITDLESRPPTTVTDTVFVDKPLDFITIGGKEYKVADIELVVPFAEKDTVTYKICWAPDYDKKWWYHLGDPAVYPHKIGLPMEGQGFLNILFDAEFTDDMKKWQQEFLIERTIDHEKGETTYRNLYVDPSEYMPDL